MADRVGDSARLWHVTAIKEWRALAEEERERTRVRARAAYYVIDQNLMGRVIGPTDDHPPAFSIAPPRAAPDIAPQIPVPVPSCSPTLYSLRLPWSHIGVISSLSTPSTRAPD
jgi:hypothetical protein